MSGDILIYRIAGNFRRCKFSYKPANKKFRTLNFRMNPFNARAHAPYTINFRSFNFRTQALDTKNTKISTIRKLPAIRYPQTMPSGREYITFISLLAM